MLRRFLVILIRRSLLILLLICLGCAAQSAPPDVARKVEHQVRAFYTIPPEVKVTVGAITPSTEMAGYDCGVGEHRRWRRQAEGLPVLDFQRSRHDAARDEIRLDQGSFRRVNEQDRYQRGRPVRGAKSAKVVVVNFDDFECPFCSRMHQTLFSEILKEYGDRVTFIYKDYPLTEIHPWALHAAVDANCLAAQSGDAYWDFADYIHANKREVDTEKTPVARFDAIDKITLLQGQKHSLDAVKLQSCVKAQNEDAVRASMKEADGLGINGTPTLFINGRKLDGAVPVAEVRAALDAALKDAGEPVPAARSIILYASIAVIGVELRCTAACSV